MKAFSTKLSCLALFMISLLFTACRKEDHHHHSGKGCRVYQSIGRIGYYQDTITVKYNSKGNPVEWDRIHVSTGTPRYEFKYDKHDRLTTLLGMYNYNNGYELMYRFAYDHKGRISSDTVYSIGFVGVPDWPEYIREYAYDNKDRLIQMKHRSLISADARWTYKYHYNQQGNLEKVTNNGYDVPLFSYDYDNKVNINSLHPIWQFLSQDYSRNNISIATAYNAQGLPTAFDQGEKREGHFANIAFSNVTVSYQCR